MLKMVMRCYILFFGDWATGQTALGAKKKVAGSGKGARKFVETIALLVAAKSATMEAEVTQHIPPDYIVSSADEEPGNRDDTTPTIPWMAEETPRAGGLTIVERGWLFSAWEEKRRRLRKG